MWPKIREAVPDAELNIYYGWGSWDTLEGENGREFHEKIDAMLANLKDQGVTEYGRVDHETLAEAMRQTKVFAYPTEFPEIFAITAVKVQAAGCIPVVTNVGALQETVQFGTKLDYSNIYSNDYAQDRFVAEVVKALKGPEADQDRQLKWALDTYSWENISNSWLEVIK
jgi:glycosyltransferase involved in cell wall biosynthesis